jgi:hypothetical protein
MATTNLQQWNPTAVNQENDAAYTADPQRTGGATDPSIFEAQLANKAFFQWSTYLTALFQAFALKGFTTSDSNLNTLTATCAGFLTTADKIAVATNQPGPLVSATQTTSAYGSSPPSAAISAVTQGSATGNYLFSGLVNTVVTFWVRADGLIGAMGLQLSGALSAASAAISGAITAATVTTTGTIQSTSGNVIGAGLISTGSASVANGLSVGSLAVGGGQPAGYVLTSNGTDFVGEAPTPLFTEGSNANGSWRRSVNGTIECWSAVLVGATGNEFASASVTFPLAFASPPVIIPCVLGLPSSGSHPNDIAGVTVESLSTSGATFFLQASVPTGGGGANFDSAVTVQYYAKGS